MFQLLRGRALPVLLLALLFVAPAQAERTTLVILHTNDTHAGFLPEPASWRKDHPLVGGTLALDAAVRAERERWQNVLLLDAGDVLTGSPLSEIAIDGIKGAALFDLMGVLGYDAMTIGNHDFDQGAANLDGLIARTSFDVLCANLDHTDGSPYAPMPGKVFEFDGVRVGIVGLVTENLAGLLPLHTQKEFEVHPVAEAARAWWDAQDPKPDLFVALTHQGVDEDRELAAAVPELDLIVGGHSHSRLNEALVVGTTRIVQAGGRMRNLGRVRMEVEDGEIVAFDNELLPLYATDVTLREELAKVVDGYQTQIDAIYGEVVGELKQAWRRRGNASNIGIFLAEALADGMGTDFGIVNNGGIRSDVDAGPITKYEIAQVLPFHNYVATFSLTGEQLLQVLGEHARRTANRGRGRVQIGYLTARWKRQGDDVVLVGPTCRGEPIDPNKTYTGTSADFVVVSQAKNYLTVEPSNVKVTQYTLADFIEKRIRELGVVDVEADDRFDEVD